jgi:molecular chaperone DnaK
MAKVSNKVCGIDLGTTNSCVAIMEGGKVKIIQHDGKNTTPSVILFNEKGEKEAVGEIAKVKATLEPGRVVFEVKRLIGRKFDSKDVKEFREIAPFQVVSSKNGDAWVKVEGKEYAPEQV